MKKLKLCLVGAGNFARYAHGASLNLLKENDPDLELTAVADLDAEKAKDFARTFNFCRAYTNWREMVETEHPDGISILTGVAATAVTACDILAAGYPVMIEKPPGRNRKEILAIQENSRRSGVPTMVALNRRYSPLLNQLLQLVHTECGEPIEFVGVEFCRFERLDDDFSTTSIHGIDTIRFLAGTPFVRVELRYQPLVREKNVWNIELDCRFQNGVAGHISFRPSTGAACERYTISTRHWMFVAKTVIPGGGSDRPGEIEIFHNGALLRKEAPTPCRLNGNDLYLSGYYGENATFIRRLREGFPCDNDLEVTLDAVEIADALRNHQANWEKTK